MTEYLNEKHLLVLLLETYLLKIIGLMHVKLPIGKLLCCLLEPVGSQCS